MMDIDWAHLTSQLPALCVGAVIGYGISTVQDWFVARFRRGGGEEGKARINFSGVAMFLIVVLVAYAAIVSQRAADDSKETSADLREAVGCLAITTFQVNNALVERSSRTASQTRANVNLQKSFSDLLATLLKPDVTPEVAGQASRQYYRKLLRFISQATASLNAGIQNPFPVPDDLVNCLHKAHIDVDLKPKNLTGTQNTQPRK